MGPPISKFELVYVCRLVGCLLPALVFNYVFYLLLCGISRNRYLADATYFIYVLGTILFPYSLIFVNHAFATGALATSFAILAARPGTGWRRHGAYVAAGALIGLATGAEYPMAFTGLFLGIYGLARGTDARHGEGVAALIRSRRHLVSAFVGVCLALLAVLWYHHSAYGGPFKTFVGMNIHPAFKKLFEAHPGGFSKPSWTAFVGSFFSPSNGLFFFSPFLLLFPLGIVAAFRQRRYRLETVLGLALIVCYTLFITSFVVWKGGWTVGPRYITILSPVMTLLALLGLTWLYDRSPHAARGLLLGLGVLSIAIITPCAVLFPHLPEDLANPLYEAIVPALKQRLVPRNLLGLVYGALTLYAAVLGVVVLYLLLGARRARGERLVGVVSVVFCLGAFQLIFGSPDRIDPVKRSQFIKGLTSMRPTLVPIPQLPERGALNWFVARAPFGDTDWAQARTTVIEYLWKGTGIPRRGPELVQRDWKDSWFAAQLKHLKRIDKVQFTLPLGLTSTAYHFHPRSAARHRVVIYHQGHADFKLGRSTIDALLADGYAVFAMTMPLQGRNYRASIRLPSGRLFRFPLAHNNFPALERMGHRPVAWLLEPMLRAVEYLKRRYQYKSLDAIGLSGGGWTVELVAALEPRVERTVSVAGSLPADYRERTLDYEQLSVRGLYQRITYRDTYFLSANYPQRRLLKVLNAWDRCCFRAAGRESRLALEPAMIVQLSGRQDAFRIEIDRTHRGHKISAFAIKAALRAFARETR